MSGILLVLLIETGAWPHRAREKGLLAVVLVFGLLAGGFIMETCLALVSYGLYREDKESLNKYNALYNMTIEDERYHENIAIYIVDTIFESREYRQYQHYFSQYEWGDTYIIDPDCQYKFMNLLVLHEVVIEYMSGQQEEALKKKMKKYMEEYDSLIENINFFNK